MKTKETQRILLTKRLIKESLIRFLAVKSIYKISIRGLCEEAEINRSTFYKYYGSQYDVLAKMETEMLGHIQEALGAASEDPIHQIETICSYLEANVDIVRLLTNNNIDPDFPVKLFNLPQIREMLHKRLGSSYDSESLDYAFTFVTSAGYFLIRKWINKKERKPANEIAAKTDIIMIKQSTTIKSLEFLINSVLLFLIEVCLYASVRSKCIHSLTLNWFNVKPNISHRLHIVNLLFYCAFVFYLYT